MARTDKRHFSFRLSDDTAAAVRECMRSTGWGETRACQFLITLGLHYLQGPEKSAGRMAAGLQLYAAQVVHFECEQLASRQLSKSRAKLASAKRDAAALGSGA